MLDDQIIINVDGQELSARNGQMLIEVTDANDIYIPRFCYHNKLSVAANCRMCLVEIEKAPKAMPACATPVMNGMQVKTRSKLAIEAQKSVMEFLLINHPLDCPICDQGGECELQDLAMGYGQDVSHYQEKKRVVKDKNIGPLIQTDLTRCIHCTRCIRFGEEIAGLREIGAIGRGENMTIGTYIEKSVDSEMSGNIIDLCPVGALTSKPFRYSARAWELVQRDGVAPHDSVGSNLHLHVKEGRIRRVVPAANESINEVWLSDRDRFSYEGIYSEDRLQLPLLKKGGEWLEVDWELAFSEVRDRLRRVINERSAMSIGAIASPASTLEELYLLQKLMRALGSHNIDTRLRQTDISDQDKAPIFPWLGLDIADLEDVDAALLIGSNIRKEQPVLNHRVRKAAVKGASISVINMIDYAFNYDTTNSLIVKPSELVKQLIAVLKALVDDSGSSVPVDVAALLYGAEVAEAHSSIATALQEAGSGIVLLGNIATEHPQFSVLRTLAGLIAQITNCKFGYLSEAANTSGAWLAGAVPHRLPGGSIDENPGKGVNAMFDSNLDAYLLLNVEPELDCCVSASAIAALKAARLVVAMTAYRSSAMEEYADIMLPVATFAETSGTYINVAGDVQTFASATAPIGDARPAWKILRVMGNYLELEGFNYAVSADVLAEVMADIECIKPDNYGKWHDAVVAVQLTEGIQRISDVPMNMIDGLCRRSSALQATTDVSDGSLHVNASTASRYQLETGQQARVEQGDNVAILPVTIDDRVPNDCVLIQSAHPAQIELGQGFGAVKVGRV